MPYKDFEKERERLRSRRANPAWNIYQVKWLKINRWKYKDRINAGKRKWIASNAAKVSKQKAQSYLKHRDRLLKKQRDYYLANTEKCKASMRIHGRVRRAKRHNCKTDSTATIFYNFVRSKKSIPCYYCGKKISGQEAHIDHVIAIAKNGNHASDNLAASCPDCNLRKGKKLPSELTFAPQPLLNL
jgi:5-methylcytosine-specific restriction endonuclease McrA